MPKLEWLTGDKSSKRSVESQRVMLSGIWLLREIKWIAVTEAEEDKRNPISKRENTVKLKIELLGVKIDVFLLEVHLVDSFVII